MSHAPTASVTVSTLTDIEGIRIEDLSIVRPTVVERDVLRLRAIGLALLSVALLLQPPPLWKTSFGRTLRQPPRSRSVEPRTSGSLTT